MYYKKLEGQLCYLSPLNPEDYEKFLPWINDIESSLGVGFSSLMISPEEEKKSLQKLASGQHFGIIDTETDEIIGTIGLAKVKHIDRKSEIGIFIGNKEYWGKGYGFEAMNLLLDYGFNILNLHNISLKVFSFNKKAIKLYKKIGFKEVGRVRECKFVGGEVFDDVIMDILSTEFKSSYILKNLKKKQKEIESSKKYIIK